MSWIRNIMWCLSSPDSSSLSETISWLWVETAHTHSLCLSFPLSNPRTTHVHKDNVCKGDCGVFWEGDLFCLKKWTIVLPRYSAAAAAKSFQLCPSLCDLIDHSPPGSPVPGTLRWTQNMSSRDFPAPACLSEGRIHKNELQTGTKWPSYFWTPRADIHPFQLLFIDRKEPQ